MSDNAERLLGELDGKMDLVLQRLDKINGTLDKHNTWIAGHDQLHATQAGAGQVRSRVWGGAWQILLLVLGPLFGALVGAVVVAMGGGAP